MHSLASEASSLPLRSYVVIPARLGSTRLPRKMLLAKTGKALIRHTYENACRATLPTDVIVATDHADIEQEILEAGGKARMTSIACTSGTDRVAEVAAQLPDAELIVNVQGDEPELNPAYIDRLIQMLAEDPTAPMATLATPLTDRELIHNPHCVKVVFDDTGRAMYFSRSVIPFSRDDQQLTTERGQPLYHQHLGIYAYRREFLLRLATQIPSPLEQAEKLEQLRVLQMGCTIRVSVIDHATTGIDTPEDYERFVTRYYQQKSHEPQEAKRSAIHSPHGANVGGGVMG